jgi:hypothetical protein
MQRMTVLVAAAFVGIMVGASVAHSNPIFDPTVGERICLVYSAWGFGTWGGSGISQLKSLTQKIDACYDKVKQNPEPMCRWFLQTMAPPDASVSSTDVAVGRCIEAITSSTQTSGQREQHGVPYYWKYTCRLEDGRQTSHCFEH